MVDGELLIAFLVNGQNGEPFDASTLASILEAEGMQLASALSIAVCCEYIILIACMVPLSYHHDHRHLS